MMRLRSFRSKLIPHTIAFFLSSIRHQTHIPIRSSCAGRTSMTNGCRSTPTASLRCTRAQRRFTFRGNTNTNTTIDRCPHRQLHRQPGRLLPPLRLRVQWPVHCRTLCLTRRSPPRAFTAPMANTKAVPPPPLCPRAARLPLLVIRSSITISSSTSDLRAVVESSTPVQPQPLPLPLPLHPRPRSMHPLWRAIQTRQCRH